MKENNKKTDLSPMLLGTLAVTVLGNALTGQYF